MLLLVLLLSLGVGDVLGVAEFAGVGVTGIDVSDVFVVGIDDVGLVDVGFFLPSSASTSTQLWLRLVLVSIPPKPPSHPPSHLSRLVVSLNFNSTLAEVSLSFHSSKATQPPSHPPSHPSRLVVSTSNSSNK